MKLTVKSGATKAPLLETTEATSIELRDTSGMLNFLILILPGISEVGGQSFIVTNKNDSDFEATATGLGFKLKE